MLIVCLISVSAKHLPSFNADHDELCSTFEIKILLNLCCWIAHACLTVGRFTQASMFKRIHQPFTWENVTGYVAHNKKY